MSKNETKKVNDPVGEYLVNKIKELESERESILKYVDLLEEKVAKYEEVKKFFKVEGDCVVVRTFDNHYVGILCVEIADKERYQKYLDLLELTKGDFE